MRVIHVIGCGGIGSYAAPLIAKTFPSARIIWQDADTVEEHNCDRQYFTDKDIGKYKADILAKRHGGKALKEWYLGTPLEADCVFLFVDNNHARQMAAKAEKRDKTMVIYAANEHEDAMAVAYTHENTLDVLKRFPRWNSDTDGPVPAGQSCTSQAVLEEKPQTTLANFAAAHHAVMLAVAQERAKREVAGTPYLIMSTTHGIRISKGELND